MDLQTTTLSVINMFEKYSGDSPDQALMKLGSFVVEFCNCNTEIFAERACSIVSDMSTSLIEVLNERYLESANNFPNYFIEDVKKYIDGIKVDSSKPLDQILPLGFKVGYLQRHMTEFGKMVYWWLNIVEGARTLLKQGFKVYNSV